MGQRNLQTEETGTWLQVRRFRNETEYIMKNIRKDEIVFLLRKVQWPAISIYMPVSRIGDQQDPIRYKTLLGQVEKQLVAGGMRPAEARSLLEPEQRLVEDKGFWMNLGADGLAVFRSRDVERRYALPLSFQELLQVGDWFHIKPLVPLLSEKQYFVLVLSKGAVRLFKGQRHCFSEIELPEDTPASLDDVLQYDDPEKQLQYHTNAPARGEGREAMYHGHGVGVDEQKENVERYLQAVDSGLFPRLDELQCPIVLAGPDELQGVYRRITKGKRILKQGINKNVRDMSKEDLHSQTWKLVAEDLSREEEDAVRTFRNGLGTGLVADEIQAVLAAAWEGRVQTLFVVDDEHVWGIFDPENGKTVMSGYNESSSVDLLDVAVRLTLEKKGQVIVRSREEMPTDSPLCAQLRF